MSEIASDTCNVSKNLLKTERALLGRRSVEKQMKGVGDILWKYFMVGCEIEDPELAAKLKEARVKRFSINAVVVVVGLTAVLQTTLTASEIARRKPRSSSRPCPVRTSWAKRTCRVQDQIFIAA